MREANSFDIFLLILLGLIWGSSFFNIKIATYSYEPITLALVRVIFASLPLILLCKLKSIKIEAFSKEWKRYALIGLCNIAIPFILIAMGTSKINSYLAAMLMSTTPLSGTILAHFFTKNEKINIFKIIGILIGFSGVLFLFLDKIIINESNYIFALITILGSTFYSIGGILTLKIKNKGNENVTTSTTIWSLIFLFPMALILEKPWLATPTLDSTLSLLYLGIVATGLAWLIRFRILSVNGLVFQTQVAYLIPIFGVFFGYFLMNEVITWRVLISLSIIVLGIYIVKKNNKGLK
ncbi:MAG: EamA family transporter [Candidatus Pelagibacter sp.]|nr:EamA family transporter [Candidatus Pelagibacter sp.]OUW68418.1 MAG: EamA family transporter [Candidatus Pelagibacter sp. TMED202]|tara:strand:- start:1081 stop:1965 length:885 start_codon:yes stop_codon:yes gene_type:complete